MEATEVTEKPEFKAEMVSEYMAEVAQLDHDAQVSLASAIVPIEQPKYPEVERLKLLFNRCPSAAARGNIISAMIPVVREAMITHAKKEWEAARKLGEM